MTTEKALELLEAQVTGISEKARKDGKGSYRLLDILLGGKPNKVYCWTPESILGVVAGKHYRLSVERRANPQGGGYTYVLAGAPQEVATPSPSPAPADADTAKAPTSQNGARERSIERQVAAYVTGTIVAAAIAKGMSPDEFNVWALKALTLAARMGVVIETGEYRAPGGSLPKPEGVAP